MDDFGHIPNVPGLYRYMAKQCSDGTWCVWDYRRGVKAETPYRSVKEYSCRDTADTYNRLGAWS
jgi:hypothetical protein